MKEARQIKRDVVFPFRDKLWDLFRDLAEGDMPLRDQEEEPLGNAFDLAWLTVVFIKLKEFQQGKKPKVPIKA
ncbi:MAG: hypothetical protein ABIR29_12850 [Chthoniobacterales bacterium]